MQHFDALIIGSGISSLVSAALLAKKGKRVCVLERYRKPGGYLHCFERFGCSFDTGAHYVGSMSEGQSFRVLLEYLGAFNESSYTPLNPEGFDVLTFPSFAVHVPTGHDKAAAALSAIFPHEKAGISKYFTLVRETALMIPTYAFNDESDANKVLEFLNTPLSAIVDSLTTNPQLKCVLYAYCTLHCVHPDDTPFAFHAVMTDSLLRGAYGFTNGGDQLAQSLVRAIEQAGGEVRLRQNVNSFEVIDQSIKSVTTQRGESFSAEWVISGMHPKLTFALVGHEHLPRSFVSRLSAMTESIPFLGVYAASNDEPNISIDTNHYIFATEDPRAMSVLRDASLLNPTQPLAAYIVRNNRSRTPGSRGFHPLTIHAPANYEWFKPWANSRYADRPEDYHRFKHEIAQNIYSFTEQKLRVGIHAIAHTEVSTPLSNLHYNGSVDGSAYGVYHGINQTGMRGLGPRTHIRNLLLTGQSTLFPGLLGSSIAGLRTAGHILGIKPILKELKQFKNGTE